MIVGAGAQQHVYVARCGPIVRQVAHAAAAACSTSRPIVLDTHTLRAVQAVGRVP